MRQRLQRAADLYLSDCYERPTAARASEFASELGLSREYLARVVRDVLGMTLRDFLRQRQLQRAETLLRTTSASIVEIAAASGFGTPRAFYRAFKAAFGTTPGRYRKVTK